MSGTSSLSNSGLDGAYTYRTAAKEVLHEFLDSPLCSASIDELNKHATPKDLLLQAVSLAEDRRLRDKDANEDDLENGDEELDLVSKALRKCLAYDGVVEQLIQDSQVHFLLLGASRSSSTRLRQLIAEQIGCLIKRSSKGLALTIESSLYDLLPDLLADVDVGVGKFAADALLASLKYQQGVEYFFSDFFYMKVDAFADSSNEMVKVRVLNLFVDAGAKDQEIFDKLAARRALDKVAAAFFTNDLLLKINAVSLLEKLGTYTAGLSYMSSGKIPQKLLREMASEDIDGTISITIVNVIADLLKLHPELMRELFLAENGVFPQTLAKFHHAVASTAEEKSELGCSIAAWGSIAGTLGGYETLEEFIPEVTPKISNCFVDEVEIANLAMDAWTHVLNSRGASLPAAAEETLKSKVAPEALKVHMSRPFGESRQHSYPLLSALCRYKFVVEAFFSVEDFRRSLLDPFSEDASEAKYAKNDYMRALVRNQRDWLCAIVDNQYLTLLQELAAGGPFYVPPGARASALENVVS